MSTIHGCRIEALENEACRAWLGWVLDSAAPPRPPETPAWLLAHSDGGVTWGRLEAGGPWRLGSDAFAELCPRPAEEVTHELRIFSRDEEVLIWRTVDGLRGRALRDAPSAGGADPVRPSEEERLLLAGRTVEQRDGFTLVGSGTGATQALPLRVNGDPPEPWPRLRLRHYFARDEETGAVRVAATRLVEVAAGGAQG